MSAEQQRDVHASVQEYYGREVQSTADLKTSCCVAERRSVSDEVKEALALLHEEVKSKNYGCGAVYPEAVWGCRVLDLGSGAGLDCFVLSRLVGQQGWVTGVDMTHEQLEVARRHIDYHRQAFGYTEANVEFKEGFIERLGDCGLPDESYDVIVSNCVVNLSPDKRAVLQEAFRVLKPGGEMYFSDVYTSGPVPEELRSNKVLWGECLSGALQWSELMEIAAAVGFAPPVLVKATVFTSGNPEIEQLLETSGAKGLQFCSATYRLMKVDIEDYSDSLMNVEYKGTIKGCEQGVLFSHHGTIASCCGVVMPASVAQLLLDSRFAPHFSFTPTTTQPAKPVCPAIRDFAKIDPFLVASSKSVVQCC